MKALSSAVTVLKVSLMVSYRGKRWIRFQLSGPITHQKLHIYITVYLYKVNKVPPKLSQLNNKHVRNYKQDYR